MNKIVKLNTKLAPSFTHTIELQNFCLDIVKFSLAESSLGYRFDFACVVPDTHTGEPWELHWAQFFPPELPNYIIIKEIYATIYNVLIHELCEAWRVDGVRQDTPHGELGDLSIYRIERRTVNEPS